MTVDETRDLRALAAETGVAELEVQRGDNRVRIRRAGFTSSQEFLAGPPVHPQTAPSSEAPKEKPEKPSADPNLILVKSPIVGTFYEAPAPDAPTFVRVGERIQPGKVLCI